VTSPSVVSTTHRIGPAMTSVLYSIVAIFSQ
jgi:hypothetical protein